MAKTKGDGTDVPRGPKGGRKHKPGRDHVKEVIKRAAQTKANKKKAAQEEARQAEQNALRERWELLSEEQRKLLKGMKGIDPDV